MKENFVNVKDFLKYQTRFSEYNFTIPDWIKQYLLISLKPRLAKDWSVWVLTGPVVNTGFNRTILVNTGWLDDWNTGG